MLRRVVRADRVGIPISCLLAISLMLVCGCSSGPSEYEKYKNASKGFEKAIADAGGNAKKEGKAMFGFQMSGWTIDLSGAKLTDPLVEQIIQVAQENPVFDLNLSKTSVTDAQLEKLDSGKVLQKTVNLNLSDTAITDAGLDKLSNFYCITNLNLKGSKASKEAARRMGDKKIANPQTPAPFKKQPVVVI